MIDWNINYYIIYSGTFSLLILAIPLKSLAYLTHSTNINIQNG